MSNINKDIAKNVLEFLKKSNQGASGSQIAEALGMNRLSLAKELEVLRALGAIDFQQVGAAKLWFKGKGTLTNTLLEEMIFGVLPQYLAEQMSEENAAVQLLDLTDTMMTNAINSNSAIREKASGYASMYDYILSCYKYVGGFHKEFDSELLEETDEKLVVKVNTCPHEKYTKNNPVACSACGGLKRSLLRELCGITTPVRVSKRISEGDPYCLYTIYKQ